VRNIVTFLCVSFNAFSMDMPSDDAVRTTILASGKNAVAARPRRCLFFSLASPNGVALSPKEWAEESLFDAVNDRNVEMARQCP